MTAPQHTRPFNPEHARAGAPYCTRAGFKAAVLKWDADHMAYPLIGFMNDGAKGDISMSWSLTGQHSLTPEHYADLVMTPLGFIDGKPVFVGDELEEDSVVGGDNTFVVGPTMRDGHFKHARWPAPEPVYPETRMDYGDLIRIAMKTNSSPMAVTGSQVVSIANAALRHAIDAEQVVPMAGVLELARDLRKNEFDKLKADLQKAKRSLELAGYTDNGGELWKPPLGKSPDQRAARDMVIAEAVKAATFNKVRSFDLSPGRPSYERIDIDLAAIIAGVKA